MIAFIEGIVVEVGDHTLILNVNGVGYALVVHQAPTFHLGQKYQFYTEAIYREDSQQLYGFLGSAQRNFFRLLVEKVNGVGPKLAMSIVGYFPMNELCNIILSEDVVRLSQCPGMGKKTAQKLILELKDHLKKQSLTEKSLVKSATSAPACYNDVICALVALGYPKKQAEKLLEDLMPKLDPSLSVEEILKKIFTMRVRDK